MGEQENTVLAPTREVTKTRCVNVLCGATVIALTLVAFLPALRNGFVNWDDPSNISDNRHIRDVSWPNLRWMFTTFHLGPYQPLSWFSLALDFRVWGLDPFGYHLTSLLLHAAAAASFYAVSRAILDLAMPRSADQPQALAAAAAMLSAVLFAIHPLRVESVAWATERRDVLSGLFAILTLWAYLKAVVGFDRRPPARMAWLAVSVLFFVASLLSKAAAVALPLVLIVIDVYPLRRLEHRAARPAASIRQIAFEKFPFVLASIIVGAVALHGQRVAGALSSLTQYGPAERAIVALHAATFYVGKTIVPIRLSPMYELPRPDGMWSFRFVAGAVAAVAVTVAAWLCRRRWPSVLAVWVCYLALLAPVSGLAQSGGQLAADRYTYLPCLGFALLAAGLLRRFACSRMTAANAPLALIGGAGLVAALLVPVTWGQTKLWRDSQTLWQHALALDRSASIARNNLARAMIDSDRLDDARRLLERAVQLRPENADAQNNLGVVLRRLGDPAAALALYDEAIRLRPRSAEIAYNVALLLAESTPVALGRFDSIEDQWRAAAGWYERCLAAQPDHIDAINGLGIVQKRLGRLDLAIESYHRALAIDSRDVDTRFNLAIALVALGRIDEARQQYRQVLELQPAHAGARHNLALLESSSRGFSPEAK